MCTNAPANTIGKVGVFSHFRIRKNATELFKRTSANTNTLLTRTDAGCRVSLDDVRAVSFPLYVGPSLTAYS